MVWWLCAIPWLACHCVRRGLPLMIEFIVRDMGFTDFQKAQLLGAFFPIYSISIIPAAAVAKIVGGKATLNVSLFGQALCLMLLPVVARAGGQRAVYLMCACMGGLGVLQGPLIPGLAPIEAAWIPQGPSRALALRIPHMGMRFHFLGAIAIPMLATSRFGWRAAPVCFGVGCGLLGCLWNFWAANTPADWRGPPKMKDDEKALFGLDKKPEGTSEASKPAKKSGALATYFFRCGRGYLPMLGHSIIAVVGASAKPLLRFRNPQLEMDSCCLRRQRHLDLGSDAVLGRARLLRGQGRAPDRHPQHRGLLLAVHPRRRRLRPHSARLDQDDPAPAERRDRGEPPGADAAGLRVLKVAGGCDGGGLREQGLPQHGRQLAEPGVHGDRWRGLRGAQGVRHNGLQPRDDGPAV